MAYNQNIPQPADQLKNSQPQLLANFQEINTILDVNHVGFNLGDQGKHKFLQMPRQGIAPATAATDLGLFAFLGANSGVSELNFRRENNGASIPFTEGVLASPGWTILPCGLVVKWGSSVLPQTPGTASRVAWNFVFPVGGNIRAFTQPPFAVFLTPSRNSLGAGDFLVPWWNFQDTTALSLYGFTDSTLSIAQRIPSYTIQYVAIGI